MSKRGSPYGRLPSRLSRVEIKAISPCRSPLPFFGLWNGKKVLAPEFVIWYSSVAYPQHYTQRRNIMAIRYAVRKQQMGGDNEYYLGRVQLKGSFSRDMVITRMLDMGSTITRADILAVLDNFEKAVKAICLEGNKVTLEGFAQFTPSVSGRFNSESDGFERSRHTIAMTAQVSSAFNTLFSRDAVMEKVFAGEKKPMLVEVVDLATGEANTRVTQGNIVTISGESLKFSPDDPDENLVFVNSADATESVEIPVFQKNTDKELVFLMPSVSFASGYFELSSRMKTLTVRSNVSAVLEVA